MNDNTLCDCGLSENHRKDGTRVYANHGQPEVKEANKYVMTVRISDSFCTWEYQLIHNGIHSIQDVYVAVRDLLGSPNIEGVLK